MAPSQKINIKDKVDDGEIDLSMCDLQEVPTKDIASIKNIYSLDLSNNHLSTLPKNFGTLTHLTKLDLSKNVLKELPENFGDLIKLKHLDLYKNELQHLPLSFNKLKALRWLDLKDNPLVPAIKEKAGPCLDTKQCQMCAKNIVQFYSELHKKVEQEREIREKQRQKDKHANELAAQKQKLQEKKNKKREKSKPKQDGDVLIEAKPNNNNNNNIKKHKINQVDENEKNPSLLWLTLQVLIAVFFMLFITLFILTSVKTMYTEEIEKKVEELWNNCVDIFPQFLKPYGNDFGSYFKHVHMMTGKGIYQLAAKFQENENIKSVIEKLMNIYNGL